MRDFHVFIQARMSSTRLPGKALMDLDGEPMTRFMLKRLDALHPIVICPDEDVPVFQDELSPWEVFGGDKENVLARFYKAALNHPARYYVRLTGDCPLVDPQYVQWYINCAMAGNYPYYGVVNAPDGNDIEVIRCDQLDQSYEPDEHVTTHIRTVPGAFVWDGGILPKYSVDTQEDLDRVRRIVSALGSTCTRHDILTYLSENP